MSENKSTTRKTVDSLFKRYKRCFIVYVAAVVLVLAVIYFIFTCNGFIPTGYDLEKGDWLAFTGAYLASAAAVFVSMVAILQSHYYFTEQNKRDEVTRKKNIQPIFSIEVAGINTQPPGAVDAFNISDLSTLPKHENVSFKIENIAEFPVLNVIIFENYLYQVLKPRDVKKVMVAYSGSPDLPKGNGIIIEISESDYPKSESGLPTWLQISYDDIDGRSMFQTFELKSFDGKEYYSFKNPEWVCC
jgi:uncharacterized membrane protein